MSRSGYSDDLDPRELNVWRGAVTSAIRGARGQAFLREMLAALDAMREKRLISGALEDGGEVCAIGCVGRQRGLDQSGIDAYEPHAIAQSFGIARALAAEIEFLNDDDFTWQPETPEQRWGRMRAWVASQIRADATIGQPFASRQQ